MSLTPIRETTSFLPIFLYCQSKEQDISSCFPPGSMCVMNCQGCVCACLLLSFPIQIFLDVHFKKLIKLSAHVSPSIANNKLPARRPSLRQSLESMCSQKSRASRFVLLSYSELARESESVECLLSSEYMLWPRVETHPWLLKTSRCEVCVALKWHQGFWEKQCPRSQEPRNYNAIKK